MADEQKPVAGAADAAAVKPVEAEKLDIEKLTADITAAAVEAVEAKYKAQLAGADRKITELTTEKETLEKAKLDEGLTADEKLAKLTERFETSQKESVAKDRAAETEKKVLLIKAEAAKRGLVDGTYYADPALSLEDNIKNLDSAVKAIEELATKKAVAGLLGGTEPGSGNIADAPPAVDLSGKTPAQLRQYWIDQEQAIMNKRTAANVPPPIALTPSVGTSTR